MVTVVCRVVGALVGAVESSFAAENASTRADDGAVACVGLGIIGVGCY